MDWNVGYYITDHHFTTSTDYYTHSDASFDQYMFVLSMLTFDMKA